MNQYTVSFRSEGQTDPAIYAGISQHEGGDHSWGNFYQWCVGLTLAGQCRWGYPGGVVDMRPGMVVIARPHTEIKWRVPIGRSWEVLSIVFHPRPHWFEWLEEHTYHQGVAQVEGSASSRLRQALLTVERLYRNRVLHRDEWALAALERALLALHDNAASEKMALDPRLRTAILFLHSHYQEPLGVREIATAAHLSPSHLSALFKEQLGTTAMQHLEQLRLERAEALLRFSPHSITEIALSAGFTDSNYFARRFKAMRGLTPREFRKLTRDEGRRPSS